jgi:hypothetical protein
MTEAIVERVHRYILDGDDANLRRLLGVAPDTREMARSALRRTGVPHGWKAIDFGCGLIRGLAVLAEMVDPAGRVVGVDFSEPAIRRTRAMVTTLALENVERVVGEVHQATACRQPGKPPPERKPLPPVSARQQSVAGARPQPLWSSHHPGGHGSEQP